MYVQNSSSPMPNIYFLEHEKGCVLDDGSPYKQLFCTDYLNLRESGNEKFASDTF